MTVVQQTYRTSISKIQIRRGYRVSTFLYGKTELWHKSSAGGWAFTKNYRNCNRAQTHFYPNARTSYLPGHWWSMIDDNTYPYDQSIPKTCHSYHHTAVRLNKPRSWEWEWEWLMHISNLNIKSPYSYVWQCCRKLPWLYTAFVCCNIYGKWAPYLIFYRRNPSITTSWDSYLCSFICTSNSSPHTHVRQMCGISKWLLSLFSVIPYFCHIFAVQIIFGTEFLTTHASTWNHHKNRYSTSWGVLLHVHGLWSGT